MKNIAIITAALIMLSIFTGCETKNKEISRENTKQANIEQKTNEDSNSSTPKQSISEVDKSLEDVQKDASSEVSPLPVELNTAANNNRIEAKVEPSNKNTAPAASPQTQTNTVQTTKSLVKIGDSESDVLRILGSPKSISEDFPQQITYVYGGSNLYLLDSREGARVVGWWNGDRKLGVTAGDMVPGSTFTLGSSKEEVVKASGTPTIFDPSMIISPIRKQTYWGYGDRSRVEFDENYKVTGWSNYGSLKIAFGTKKPGAPPVKLGSTLEDVLSAFGTPTGLNIDAKTKYPKSLVYGNTGVLLDDNKKVAAWNNKANYNITAGDKKPSAQPAVVNSTFQEIIDFMGTPDTLMPGMDLKPHILIYTMSYGRMIYTMDTSTQRVASWEKVDHNNHRIESSRP